MRGRAFTLLEIMVSVVVLTILVIIVSRIVNSATTITTLGNKRLDTDSQIRPVFDRMAVDLSQMIKRTDVDYYVKGSFDLETASNPQHGPNDHLAFFCQSEGYYPSTGSRSPISLVAYRINDNNTSASYNKMERLGKGLVWNGVSATNKPLLFGLQAIANNWAGAGATDNVTADPDSDYELIGPQIFRFEYFYLLKTGAISNLPGTQGLQDVAAIVGTIAALDPKTKVLLSDAQIATLIGRLVDFDPSTHTKIADLPTAWQNTLDGTTDMVRPAISGIRIYQRSFYLLPKE
jgi:prepilin-type N-terminal cleavage/methylation domain-containing protein